MEILILNPFFYPYLGGTEKHIHYIGRRLAKSHNIKILTARLKGTEEKDEIDGLQVVRTPADVYYDVPHPIPPPMPVFKEFRTHILKHVPDAEIVHLHNRFVYSPDDIKTIRDSGKKVLLTLHNARPNRIDFWTNTFGGLYDDLFSKRVMRQCHGITAVSANTMNVTVPRDYHGITEVIHNGVDTDLFVPGKGADIWRERFRSSGLVRRIVLTNVRLIAQKGLPYLIQAMKGVDADLVVFGRGPLKEQLENYAKSQGIKACFISDRISDEELVALYAAADIFVLPSLYEPCAVALLEAMSCGKPIVATDAGGNPELILDGECGLVVPARSPDAMRTAIRRYLEDEGFARQMGAAARRRAIARFTWDMVAKRFDDFYRRFL